MTAAFADVRDAVLETALARPETQHVSVSPTHTHEDITDHADALLLGDGTRAMWCASLTRGDTEWSVLTRLHGSDSITRTWTDDSLALWRAFLKDCDGPDRRHEPQDTERTPA